MARGWAERPSEQWQGGKRLEGLLDDRARRRGKKKNQMLNVGGLASAQVCWASSRSSDTACGPVFIKAAVVSLWPNWNSVVGWETGYLGVRPDFTFTVWSWVSFLSFLNFSFFDYEMEWMLILAPSQQHADLLPKSLVKISCSTQWSGDFEDKLVVLLVT